MAEVEAQPMNVTTQGAGHMAAKHEANKEALSGKQQLLRLVEGILICKGDDEATFREAVLYQPKAGEVFVVAYPKSGITWTQLVTRRVLHHRHESPVESAIQCMLARFRFYRGSETPGAVIKTHMAFDKALFSEEAKYIYVLRNPYDCCVSYYYQRLGQPDYGFISFDDFFDEFLEGQVPFGDFFDFLASWFPQTNRPNVLCVPYEHLKKDTRSGILRIADFLGQECGKTLRDDVNALDAIIKETSPDNMRSVLTEAKEAVLSNTSDEEIMKLAEGLRKRGCGKPSTIGLFQGKTTEFNIVRKATVGDWRNLFSSSQVERMRAHMMSKISSKMPEYGEALLSLWKDVCPM